MPNLLLSRNQHELEEAVTFIEDVIDDIDHLCDDVTPHKDIISVSRSQYEESFPEYAKVCYITASDCETVTNFKFDQIPLALQESSVKNPVVITSVRKSVISNQLRFGKQYVVETADKDEIKINYEHEGSGDLKIPNEVASHLFIIRTSIMNRKSAIEHELEDICLR